MVDRKPNTIAKSLIQSAGQRPFTVGVIGSLLLWLSFPPVGLWPLAWLALVPWLLLVRVDSFQPDRSFQKIWFAGLCYWLASLYFIPLPHWALWFGWIALSLYLSVYPLLFVWIARLMVHERRIPIALAAPITFAGLEWVRAHMISGFGMIMLANSQAKVPLIIQVCDLAGAYGLTFIMVFFAACITDMLTRTVGNQLRWATPLSVVVALTIGYGVFHVVYTYPFKYRPSWDFIIVQGSVDTRFPTTEREQGQYAVEQYEHYRDLQKQVMDEHSDQFLPRENKPEDLSRNTSGTASLIWPEGKFPILDILPSDRNNDEWAAAREQFRPVHAILTEAKIDHMLVGGSTYDPNTNENFNSGLLLDKNGEVTARYFKNHLVIFGEYVPLSDWFPVLEKMTPIGRGIDRGHEPVPMKLGQRPDDPIVSPNICFESTVSHLIRAQTNHLTSVGKEPDILVNLTDDGWFFGTALLDHHLACNIIRAVENRKPVLVAANTGLSANIDGAGRLIDVGPRRQTAILNVTVQREHRQGLYRTVGDWPAVGLVVVCVWAIMMGWIKTRREARE